MGIRKNRTNCVLHSLSNHIYNIARNRQLNLGGDGCISISAVATGDGNVLFIESVLHLYRDGRVSLNHSQGCSTTNLIEASP